MLSRGEGSTMRTAALVALGAFLVLALCHCSPATTAQGSVAPPATQAPPTATQPTSTRMPIDTPASTPEPQPSATATVLRVEARVTRVIDGDTIEVQIVDQTYCVCYLGSDAPEADQQGGSEAAEANRKLVEGQAVQLEKDVSDTDQGGCLLRYVYAGQLFVNAQVIDLGYAFPVTSPPDVRYAKLFLRRLHQARELERGLWAPVTPESSPTGTWRYPLPPRGPGSE